jgi:hypothetical protein
MSVLAFPRIYFRGVVSWDPNVANNDPRVYDLVTARVGLQPGETTADFRRRMIETTRQRGDWNYYGSHTCTFERVQVTGGELRPGSGLLQGDALLYSPVDLVGKLVDIDPTSIASQLFFDELSLGVAGRPHLLARPRRRMSSRWLHFSRNLGRLPIAGGASANWQAVFPMEGLEFVRGQESALLGGLEEALRARGARGLMLRFNTYRTVYFQNGLRNPLEPAATPEELQRLHAQGKPVPNPAYSLVVGVLGPWFDGERESVPGGRLLIPVGVAPVRNALDAPAACGLSVVEFEPTSKTLSIDLSSAIPELNPEVEKADFGPLSLVLTRDGQDLELARLEPASYNRAAYEARAGIVDVHVPRLQDAEATLAGGTLSLRATGQPLLAEQELVVASDDCNVYLDEGEQRTLTLRVRERGAVPQAPLSVQVAFYDFTLQHTGTTQVLPVSAEGAATLELRGEAPGLLHLAFTAFRGDSEPAPPDFLPIDGAEFTSVRTLPFDDALEAGTPDSALTWDFIYTHVLQPYDALTPRMSNVIRLDDPDAVRTFARRFKEVTSEALLESRRYMPITRDLSRGKRKLLHRYCDLVLSAPPTVVAPTAPPLAARAAAAPAQPAPEKPLEKRALPPE